MGLLGTIFTTACTVGTTVYMGRHVADIGNGNRDRLEKVAKEIDGMQEKLVASEKKLSRAEGVAEGNIEGQAREKQRTQSIPQPD